ncbi:MAG: peptide chain release factor N(5)-glutamine methyltransferase [Lachnospiraceae bacterium]|nr:peptide chain release factor N(5)-glutamine methyltransferase [Lachnospiraceae bacterium]
MTYRELLSNCADVPDNERLLMGIMNWSLGEFLRYAEDESDPKTVGRFQEGIGRLRAHEPLQYILGEAPFYGRMFRVDRRVLIPRFDTEILVSAALRKLDERNADGAERPRVLDLCTGSGCIALTLLLEHPDISMTASDLSADALDLAKENARRLSGSEETVRWIQSDLFDELDGVYDLIVTNPPYIKNADIETLDPEVRDHEPHTALAGGDDGLQIIRRIAKDAKAYLFPQGQILMEIGDEEGEDVLRLFKEEGYEEPMILKDLAGRDRVLTARRGRNG